ncbi:MarR family winged helix-turn-helix transcriptional regulator [Streptomyces sp. NPDC058459]|uniref:MarR family winged helix-turn-helix transcriptional regulator n=1 Tax=Streptomyces sp. NPDC058459 TaxID=3346508 RepID=UPI00364DFE30
MTEGDALTKRVDGAAATRIPVNPVMTMILQARSLESRLETALQERGLSMRKLGLLGHLASEPGISFSSLARRAGIRVQSLHPIVESMITAGLVQAVGGVGQGRAAVMKLTNDGHAALRKAGTLVAELDAEVFVDDDWRDLRAALVRVGESEWARLVASHETTV